MVWLGGDWVFLITLGPAPGHCYAHSRCVLATPVLPVTRLMMSKSCVIWDEDGWWLCNSPTTIQNLQLVHKVLFNQLNGVQLNEINIESINFTCSIHPNQCRIWSHSGTIAGISTVISTILCFGHHVVPKHQPNKNSPKSFLKVRSCLDFGVGVGGGPIWVTT